MATQAAPSRPFNRPRFTTVVPVPANAELASKVYEALGGKAKLAAFIKAFTAKRFAVTGWRTIKDITSRDTKHAAAMPNTPATDPLDEPFQSLTANLAAIVEARTDGALKLTRDESLSVIADLKADAELLQSAGIKLWDDINANLGYVTLGCSALPPGQIPEAARQQAMELEF